MRCPYCGNENPDKHRFCGMCGKPVPEPTAEVEVVEDHPPAHQRAEPTTPAPAYTGGIFNLNAPRESSSRNLEYLLEDDEPKSRKGWLLFVVVALALVAGLGWLRWRHGGLPLSGSLILGKPSGPTGTIDSATNASAGPAPASSSETPAPHSAPTPAPSTGGEAQSSQLSASETSPAAAPSNPPPAQPAGSVDQPPKPTSDSSDKSATVVPAADGAKAVAEPETSKSSDSTPAPAPVAKPAARKPSPAPAQKAAPSPTDPVTLGERYLYGRNGVPQNCERGLRYIKPAADQSNPKAMITLGALYATGHCLSRDLPTAYRYFALALRIDPENGPLRQNVDMVWKQMTAEERKQAIRLTQ